MEYPCAAACAEEIGPEADNILWVHDEQPGIRRRPRGKGFCYLDIDGKTVEGPTRRRIKSLVIPPAWTDVWICRDPGGHIQATGRDVKGRKQYIYHPRYRQWREQQKFERVLDFANALPKLRQKVASDLVKRRLSRDLVLATAVRVLDRTLMRIGNDEYAKQNQSYGLTTLLTEHIELGGRHVRFSFRAKSGKTFNAELFDRRVTAILRRLEGLPGQHLFQYVDEQGEPQRITSDDVNAYIREATGGDFTAKDFRTWAATALAVTSLLQLPPAASDTAVKRNLSTAIRNVARRLGNTPAVCRASYVHPQILESYRKGSLNPLFAKLQDVESEEESLGLSHHESEVLQFLKSSAQPQELSKKATVSATELLKASLAS